MPADGNRRYFMTETKIPHRMYYKVIEWVKEKDYPTRKKESIREDQLINLDFMIVEITQEGTTERSFETVWGPLLDFGQVESVLSYDYGEEGSRLGVIQASA